MNMEDYIKSLMAEGTSKEKIAEKFALELEKAFEKPKNPYKKDKYIIYKNGEKIDFILSNLLDMLITYYSLYNSKYANMSEKEIETVRKSLEKNIKIFFDISIGKFDSIKKEFNEIDNLIGSLKTNEKSKDPIKDFLDSMGF